MRRIIGLIFMLVAVSAITFVVWIFGSGLDISSQEEHAIQVMTTDVVPLADLESELNANSGSELMDPFAADLVTVVGDSGQIELGSSTATLQIPRLQQVLPVYLGATYKHLYSATAFVAGSDLPSEAENTHVVVAGHRGYYGQVLFLNLNLLRPGDSIYLYFNGQQYHYRVTGQSVVDANETETLLPVAGNRLLTLLTCTPIPTFEKRLLIRAELVGVTSAGAPSTNTGDMTTDTADTSDIDNAGTDNVGTDEVTEGLEDSPSLTISVADLIQQIQSARQEGEVDQRLQLFLTAYPFILVFLGLVILYLLTQLVRSVRKLMIR